MDINLQIECKNVAIVAKTYKTVAVEIEYADMENVLDNFTLKQIVDNYGTGVLLDQIGIEECKRYFDLVEDSEK